MRSITAPAESPTALKVFVKILTADAGRTPDQFWDDVSCPIRFVWGDEDPFTPLEGPYGIYFSELCANSKDPDQLSMAIVRAGHCPHDDNPTESNAASLPFLRRLAAPSASP